MSHIYSPPSLEIFFGDGDATDGSDSTYRAKGVLDPVTSSVTVLPVAGIAGGSFVLPAPATAKARLAERLDDIDNGIGFDGYDLNDVAGANDPKVTHNENDGAIRFIDGLHASNWLVNREFVEGFVDMLAAHGF